MRLQDSGRVTVLLVEKLLATGLLAVWVSIWSGCGGGSSSDPPAALPPAAPPAQAVQPQLPVAEQLEGAASQTEPAAVPQVSYGGETTARQQVPGGPGGFFASSPDDEDGGSQMQFGGGTGFNPNQGSQFGLAADADSEGGSDGSQASGVPPAGLAFGGLMGGQDGMNLNAGGGDFAMVNAFLQQSCTSCHSAINPKGGVRLEGVSSDLSASPELWRSVAEQLETGNMPPAVARQPDAAMKARVIAFINASLGSAPTASYLSMAQAAYRKGDWDTALRMYYAELLTADDDQLGDLLNHYYLYRPRVAKPEDLTAIGEHGQTIKPRLTTALRFAVGVILDLGPQVTDVKPVGVRQAAGAGGAATNPDSFGLAAGAAGQSRLESFQDLTGELGSTLLAAFEERSSAGRFGTLFKDLKADRSTRTPSGQPVAAAATLGAGLTQRDPGDDGQDGLAGLPAIPLNLAPSDTGLGGAQASSRRTLAGQNLTGGLIYLGKGTLNELLEQMVQAEADGLFVFDIKASKNNRTGFVTNETRVRFLLSSGKVVATTPRVIKNIDIERALMQGKPSDEVQKQIDQLFSRLDDILVLDEIPSMPESAALRHIHGLLHGGEHPLRVMAEAKLLQARGILSLDQLSTIFQVVLEGNEGESLARGTAEDRKLVLDLVLSDL